MAWFKESSNLIKVIGNQAHWTKDFGPGVDVPYSGIYKCTGCKKEVTSNQGDPFPPQNHHQHSTEQGPIRWKLIVRTNTDGD